ncbi:AraC family transcriptional regulator, L-rhamnose operon regulatory protein RhaS [Anaeromicropila populeti]|uniref:AraC family transcriptional regulator, L-rhamnose operon regulatory protein RhaS n=1 Tax=Anaeromicropila populeti TaxID=37658 RepID=A0A1I6HJT0_9FIRM|nr:AraC family transcriptional regulator, L-rhamnose operon regulatory protein RhaS [Anaeromicropila populeti]
MDFVTIGKNYYCGYRMELCVRNDAGALAEKAANEYFKIIYIESETLHIALNKNFYILTGANVICLNEQDQISFKEEPKDNIMILFFKPFVINNKFCSESFYNQEKLSLSERQDLEFLNQFQHNCSDSLKIRQLYTSIASVIKQKFELLSQQLVLQNSSYWPCRSRSYLLELLFVLNRFEEESPVLVPQQQKLKYTKLTEELIDYLQTCYNQKFTIESLAKMFHTNRTTLLKEFKQSTGQSITNYVIEFRIFVAASLLRNTELAVSEICERTGFHDMSYFSRVFKKKIKLTPSKYRNLIKNNTCQ